MLCTSNISFAYTAETFFHFPDLDCEEGEALLILGGSGRGKTTLLHLLGGLLTPREGKVLIDGTDIAKLSQAKLDTFRGQKIGIVFQQSHFVSSLSVMDNLLLANFLSGLESQPSRAKLLAKQLDIDGLLSKKTSEISIGEQQRVSIARALMNEPSVILADEPTSSLDDENCGRVIGLLKEQARIANAVLVIVTHDQRLKDQFTNRVEL